MNEMVEGFYIDSIDIYDRSIVPSNPRVEKSLRTARKFIKEAGIDWLPVNPYDLYKLFGWGLFSISEAEDIFGGKDPLQIKKSKSDAKTIRVRNTGEYITVYDERHLPGRVRWTLAHEIGHIRLGHLTDFRGTSVYDTGLNDTQYKVLEREANLFAAELLAPMSILKLLWTLSCDDIVSICDISKEAARYRESDLRLSWNKSIYREADDFFKSQFREYLIVVSNYKKIINLPITTTKNNLSGSSNKASSKEQHHKKLYVKIGPDYKYLECPRCGNTDFSLNARFCKMCGLYLFNTCGNPPDIKHEEHEPINNPGDARYCEYCGKETFLFRQGFLKSWKEVLKEHNDISAGLDKKDD